MSSLPAVTPAQLIRVLERDGFRFVRAKGSHRLYRRDEPVPLRRVTVPFHRRDLPKGTLRGILKDAGISPERLRQLL